MDRSGKRTEEMIAKLSMVNLSRTTMVSLDRIKVVRQNRTEVVNEIGLCKSSSVPGGQNANSQPA